MYYLVGPYETVFFYFVSSFMRARFQTDPMHEVLSYQLTVKLLLRLSLINGLLGNVFARCC